MLCINSFQLLQRQQSMICFSFPRGCDTANWVLLWYVRHHWGSEWQPRHCVHQDLRAGHSRQHVQGREARHFARGTMNTFLVHAKVQLFWFSNTCCITCVLLSADNKCAKPHVIKYNSGECCRGAQAAPRWPSPCWHVRHQEVLHRPLGNRHFFSCNRRTFFISFVMVLTLFFSRWFLEW